MVHPGICYGQTDLTLADSFHTEAEQVGSKLQDLSFDAVYSSPLKRCLALAHFCGFNNPIVDNRLMELNFGVWEMCAWDTITDPQLELWFQDWVNEKPTGGESYVELFRRVSYFLNELISKKYHHVCIFTHAGVMRAARVFFTKQPMSSEFDVKLNYGDTLSFDL